TVPHGDRSGVVVEPYLTEQWYCDAKTLAQPAIEAVETGKTQFVPKNWENTYFEWMRNIQPWCISRQLWWGHQIPAWYGPLFLSKPKLDPLSPLTKCFVALSEEEALKEASAYYWLEHGFKVEIAANFEEAKKALDDAAYGNSTIVKIYRDEDVLD